MRLIATISLVIFSFAVIVFHFMQMEKSKGEISKKLSWEERMEAVKNQLNKHWKEEQERQEQIEHVLKRVNTFWEEQMKPERKEFEQIKYCSNLLNGYIKLPTISFKQADIAEYPDKWFANAPSRDENDDLGRIQHEIDMIKLNNELRDEHQRIWGNDSSAHPFREMYIPHAP